MQNGKTTVDKGRVFLCICSNKMDLRLYKDRIVTKTGKYGRIKKDRNVGKTGSESRNVRKKAVLWISVLLVIRLAAGIGAFAAGELSLRLRTNKITSGGSLSVGAALSADAPVGAVRFGLTYQRDVLSLRSVDLSDKAEGDIFQYNDDGEVIWIVMSCSEHPKRQCEVTFRFQRNGSNVSGLEFSVVDCTACDIGEEWMSVSDTPALYIEPEKAELTSSETPAQPERSVSSKAEVSAKMSRVKETASKSSSVQENTSDAVSETTGEETAVSDEPLVIVKEQSFPVTQVVFLCIFGSCVAVSAVAFVFYRLGSRNGRR